MLSNELLAECRIIGRDAEVEARTLFDYQDQRKVPPLTAVAAAVILAGRNIGAVSDNLQQLENGLDCLFTVMRMCAEEAFAAGDKQPAIN
jgi:hypothetical protein